MAAKKSLSFALEPRATASIDDYVADCVWAPDSKSFAIAGGEGKVALARAEGDALTVEVVGEHLLGTLSIVWRPHANVFATSGQDSAVALWDGTSGQRDQALEARAHADAGLEFLARWRGPRERGGQSR